jgi:hypothetical protein
MNRFPDKATAERVRRMFPIGCTIELLRTDDPYTALLPGDMGEVLYVDNVCGVHANWSNGSTLAMIYGHDEFRRVDCV